MAAARTHTRCNIYYTGWLSVAVGRREASQATLSMLPRLLERGKLGGAHVRVALVGGADSLVHQVGLEVERREGGRRRHNRMQHPRRTHAADGGWAAEALLWSAQSRPGPKPCVPGGPCGPTATTTTELSTCCVCHGRGVVDLRTQLQRGRPTVQRGVPSGAERRGGVQCQCSANAVPVYCVCREEVRRGAEGVEGGEAVPGAGG